MKSKASQISQKGQKIDPLAALPYPIYFLDTLSGLSDYLGSGRLSIQDIDFLLIDENVYALYYDALPEGLRALPFYILRADEENKSLSMAGKIVDAMLEASCNRTSTLFSIGGGITTDMGGFVSSIYQRGIKNINIPTTLLSMIDASIGGKCGVNSPLGKNMMGSFKNPEAVYIIYETLASLPYSELASGLAEGIKMAQLFSKELFCKLEQKRLFYPSRWGQSETDSTHLMKSAIKDIESKIHSMHSTQGATKSVERKMDSTPLGADGVERKTDSTKSTGEGVERKMDSIKDIERRMDSMKSTSIDLEALRELLPALLGLKAEVVAGDFYEALDRQGKNSRALLNYGHTFGHAIEVDSGYALSHGASIGAGMVLAQRLGAFLGLDVGLDDRLEKLLASYDIAPFYPLHSDMLGLVLKDKKARGKDSVDFIFISSSRTPFIQAVSRDSLLAFIETLQVDAKACIKGGARC